MAVLGTKGRDLCGKLPKVVFPEGPGLWHSHGQCPSPLPSPPIEAVLRDARTWPGGTCTAGTQLAPRARLVPQTPMGSADSCLPITCQVHSTGCLQPSKPSSNRAQQVPPAPGQLCGPGDWPHSLACSARPLGSRPSFSLELLDACRQLTGSGAWRSKRALKHKVSRPGCGLHSLP